MCMLRMFHIFSNLSGCDAEESGVAWLPGGVWEYREVLGNTGQHVFVLHWMTHNSFIPVLFFTVKEFKLGIGIASLTFSL